MDIKTILLAADLSDHSRVASYHAIGIARHFGARIVILHVDEIGAPDEPVNPDLAAYLAEVAARRMQWLAGVEKACAAAGVQASSASVIGESDEGILGFVEEHGDIDLIVMGRSGAQRARRFFVGSTVTRVLRGSDVPVLVVPFEPETDTPPTEPVEVRRILTTTDFSEASHFGVRFAHQLSHALESELIALHVGRFPLVAPLPEEVLTPPTAHLDGLLEEVEAQLQEHIDEVDCDHRDHVTVKATVGTSVPKSILDVAESDAVDMIIIPSRGRGRFKRLLLGSTVDRVLGGTSCPLLVLPKQFTDRNASGE